MAGFRLFDFIQVDKVHPMSRGEEEAQYTVFFFGDNTQYCNMLIKSQFQAGRF